MHRIGIFLLILAVLFLPRYAFGFDCRKAATDVERRICSNSDLLAADAELARVYLKALNLVSYRDEFKKQQRAWIKNLRDTCQTDACIEREYRDRIAALTSSIVAAGFVRPKQTQSDRDTIIAAAQKMRLEPIDPRRNYSAKQLEERKFCTRLLEDLKAGKDVEFVEPIVFTDDYNDPKLQGYLGRCPKLKPYKQVYWQPNIWEMLEQSDYEKEDWEDFGRKVYASLDFRFYQVDFDGHPHNGKEFLFYGGRSEHFTLLNLDRCEELEGVQVCETIDSSLKSLTKDMVGVIKYQAIQFIYEWAVYDYYSNFYRWDHSSNSIINACSFRIK